MTKPEYTVVVGNIGTVYDGPHINEALRIYNTYVDTSVRSVGRGGGESVTMFRDGEPYKEFLGVIEVRDIMEAE